MSILLDRSGALCVRNVEGKGRGVFANIPFAAGEVIERAPSFGFDRAEAALIDQTRAFQYYFVRNDRDREQNSLKGYFVFGLISIVNHSSKANAKIVWQDEDSGAWASIVATRAIAPGEEITHHYTNVSEYPTNVRFID